MKKLTEYLRKYRFALWVLLIGIFFMLLPGRESEKSTAPTGGGTENFSLEETETQMEGLLRQVAGVGQVKVMLALQSGSALQLAQDGTQSRRDTEEKQENQVVKLNRGSGTQEIVVTRQTYPVYRGAVVVCQGADNAGVRLAVTEAVSVLTGLSSEKISVVKWES